MEIDIFPWAVKSWEAWEICRKALLFGMQYAIILNKEKGVAAMLWKAGLVFRKNGTYMRQNGRDTRSMINQQDFYFYDREVILSENESLFLFFNEISENSPTATGGGMNHQNKINGSGGRREIGIPH